MKKANRYRKHIFPYIVYFIPILFCVSFLSCTPSHSYRQFKLETDETLHFTKTVSIASRVDNVDQTIHAAIVGGDGSDQLVAFISDSTGAILESVAYNPPIDQNLTSDILFWFPTEHSLYLVFETTTFGNNPQNQLHFLLVDKNRIQDSSLQDVLTFSGSGISIQNMCVISNHILMVGSYNMNSSEYGIILDFVETEPSHITLQKTSLLHIPTNRKSSHSPHSICSVIPNVSVDQNTISVHFATHNGFVGTFHAVDGTKNCYAVPGFYPDFQNKMFSSGENILLENHPRSSYDADFIQIYFNGKTDHIHLFNQYPDLSYEWIAKKRIYDGSAGMIVLGFQENSDLFLVAELDSSYSTAQGWFTQNRYRMKKFSSSYAQEVSLRIEGFYPSGESSLNENVHDHSYLEYIENPWRVSQWKPSLEKMKKNFIPDPDKTHIYYEDQQNNTLDLKIMQREVLFMKPFPVSDMTGKILHKTSVSISLDNFEKLILLPDKTTP
jgi:REP element-mobilizing transposase RayT